MKKLILFALSIIVMSCTKEEPVIADFDYIQQQNGIVDFINTSINADSYEWDFGTGDNSSSRSPSYKFASNKDYFVTLTARGESGQNSKSKTIRITTAPTTGNYIIWTNVSNQGYITVTLNGSSVGTITKYGGNTAPNCGTDGYVTISRPAGSYSFEARGQGGSRWSGILNFEAGKCKTQKLIE